MTADRPREILIHQSANRPNQILGGDRELVLVTILVSVSLAFSLATVWGIGLAVGFWIGSIAVLQRMGKADPILCGKERRVQSVCAAPFPMEVNSFYAAK
jgi:type IV secretion system protein VirB3